MKKCDAELGRFKDYLLEKGKQETTIKDYIRHMTNFEKWLRSEWVSPTKREFRTLSKIL
ncbi:hypothetical protein [Bacillus cereus]|uniref:hypothetical protein n=1 Tax=Bacillus cereus TaxID=1396 RepID=UPI0039800D51